MADFFSDRESYQSEPYRQLRAQYQEAFIDMLLDLDRSLAPRQRAAAVAKLRDYARQLRDLAGVRSS
jgi:hypothetical protein